MCGHSGVDGFLTSDDVRNGYIKPHTHPWRKVAFANVDGRAVFEGCILLGNTADIETSRVEFEQQVRTAPELLSRPHAKTQGVAIKGAQFRWPKGTIPYVIDPAMHDPDRIRRAMALWEGGCGIRFKPRSGERDYLSIRHVLGGCASGIGRINGAQELIASDTCSIGNIAHELGHTIGLWHEHSRSDRDDFVEILFENIDPDQAFNFRQVPDETMDVLDYDYGSIMHYQANAFGLDDQSNTIKPRRVLLEGVKLGQRVAPSIGDFAAVDRLYADEFLAHA